MAYLGLSPDYPDQYFTSPGEPLTCGDYCATMKSEFYSMRYLPRPEGCICPGESPEFSTELPMTPQQIEAAIKRNQAIAQMTPQQIEAQVKQAPQAGGGLALAAIAALLLLG
jgi:hypothetical protein